MTVSVEKLSQLKSDEISICLKNTLKRRSFNDDSLVFLSSFSSSMMFQNFYLIIVCFLFFRNTNWFCRWIAFAKIFCICLWMFSSSSRTWLHSVFTLFHFIIKKVRLHLQLRCTHSMQRSILLSTRHFFCKWLQCLQECITAHSKLICSRKSLWRKIEFLIVWWKNMKKKWFSRWKS